MELGQGEHDAKIRHSNALTVPVVTEWSNKMESSNFGTMFKIFLMKRFSRNGVFMECSVMD